jgi:iron complex transport system substrate-binding protein
MRAAAAMVLAALSAAAAQAADAGAPRRIASFNLCADQLVVALADPDQVVGVSVYAHNPEISVVAERAKAFPLLPMQAEALVPHQPDLVLVSIWDRPLTQRLLRSLGFRVATVGVVNDFDASRAQIREIAALIGQRQRGEALIADMDAALGRLARAPRPASSTALLIGSSGYTAGRDSLAAALLAATGLAPPAGVPQTRGGYVPLERLIELRPDYLVMARALDHPDGQSAVYLTHPALQALYPAARRIVLPSRFTVCGGPALIAALDYLAEAMLRLAAAR